MNTSSLRLTFLAALTVSGLAFAQPANDLCSGAQVIPSTSFPVLTTTVSLAGAAALSEATPSCQVNTASSVWYAFTPTVSASYVFQTCTPTGNTLSDTVISIYTGTCGAPVEMAGGCNDDGCSFKSTVTIALNAGTPYLIQVAKYSNPAGSSPALATDTMQMQVEQLLRPANDTCSGTIPALTVDRTVDFSINSITTNDAIIGGGAACFLGTGNVTTSTAAGRDVVFGFTPPSSGNYSVRLQPQVGSSSSGSMLLYMTDSCTAAMTPPQTYAPPQCIAAANRTLSSSVVGEELVCLPLNSGTPYFVWADESAAATVSLNYEIEVSACFPEAEPNDAPAAANPLNACPITGRIASGEADFFSLGAPPSNARVYTMIDGNAAGNAGTASSDFDLRITNATDTLEFDDGDGDGRFGGFSPNIAGTPLPSGVPAFVRVSYFGNATTSEPYRLYSTVQTSTPVNETEPNDTTAQANAAAVNHFAGDVSSTTDVDLYAIDVRTGDGIFLSLDSQPSRSGSAATANMNVALLNPAGAVLLAMADSNTTVNNTVPPPGVFDAGTPAVPGDSLVWRARTSGVYYARVTRTSSTGTSAYVLSVARNCAPGGGIGAPTVSSANPATGSIVGNTAVTISGSGFSAGTQILIGGQAATIVSRGANSIDILTPPGTEGAVDITAINAGNQSFTLPGGFTYFAPIAPPTVTAVTPNNGSTNGNTNVTIDGTLFKLGALVTFTVGTTPQPATNVVVVNATRLTATTPAHAAGFATVTVRNPVDALEGSLNNAFEFITPPSISSVSPVSGLTSGGYPVTVNGANFRTGAVVRFGTLVGTAVVVAPGGASLTVNAPLSPANGAVNVSVTNPDGQVATLMNGFTYVYPAPSIANVTPPSGFAAGGQTITLNGNNFLSGATVTVGGAMATNVVRVSATRLTATTPAGMAGPVDIVVTNPDMQAATLSASFTYIAAPTVTAIAPNHGPVQGGTLVTLTGTGFLPNAAVSIGGVPAFAVTVTSATTATAITNGAPAGVGDVVFTNADTQRGTLPMAFTFDAAPTLVSVSPVSGSSAGGARVTLTGTGFLPGATVLFGTDPSPMVTVMSSTSVQAEAPAHAVGVVSISLRNTDNQLADLPRAFRYVDPPTLTAVGPNTGDVSGGTLITLTGTGFTPGSTVTLDGVPATQVAFVSATELTAFTPPHAPAMVDVVVSSDGVPATLVYGFTYTRGAPTLASVAPVSGPTTGGTLLTLTGSGFASGATVTVGGAMATNVVIVSPVLARVVVPAHAAGTVDVVLTNDDMQAATLSAGFTYVTPPSGNMGVADGGGGLGNEPVGGGGGAGGVSCGCTSFDGSMLSLGGMGLLLVLSRRRRRS